jgi:hypothetical protein
VTAKAPQIAEIAAGVRSAFSQTMKKIFNGFDRISQNAPASQLLPSLPPLTFFRPLCKLNPSWPFFTQELNEFSSSENLP